MWAVITENKKGYSLHPETIRWKGKPRDLYSKHEELVSEMIHMGYFHHNPLDKRKTTGVSI